MSYGELAGFLNSFNKGILKKRYVTYSGLVILIEYITDQNTLVGGTCLKINNNISGGLIVGTDVSIVPWLQLYEDVATGATPPTPPFASTKSLLFDGVDERVSANSISNAGFFGDAHTITGWGKLTDATIGRSLCGAGLDGAQGYSVIDFFLTDGKIYARTRNTAGSENAVPSLASFAADTDWHFFAMSVNATGHIVRYVIDGVNQGNDSTFDLDLSNFDSFYMGQLVWDSLLNFWKGNIDEVAVYDRVLSLSEIQEMYNLGSPLDLTTLDPQINLVSWWRNGDDPLDSTGGIPVIVDQIGLNDGAPLNMEAGDIVLDAP